MYKKHFSDLVYLRYTSGEYWLTPSIDTQSTCLYQHIGGLLVDMFEPSLG